MKHPTSTRRKFIRSTAALATAPAPLSTVTAGRSAAAAERPGSKALNPRPSSMKIGFHTDAFNSAYWSFQKCLEWAGKNDVHYIECGLIDGVSWIDGLRW